MKYSKEEVAQFITEEDVKFIRLAFCDVYGRQKNISIMPGELDRAFEYGIAIDASAIAGFGGEVHSDLLLPWRPEHGKVVRMFCSVTYPDGAPFEADTRSLLRRAVCDAEAEGITFAFGSEMEFYLFKCDENGNSTGETYDNAGYMDVAPDDKGENIRREICLMLERMGITPESSHHEEGPGQNEIDFCYSGAMTAADDALTFRTVVNTVAARNGLRADFSPKPIDGRAGNGMHINFAARDSGNIGSYQGNYGFSQYCRRFIQTLRAEQGAGVYLMVGREPLATDKNTCRGGRIPPRGTSFTRPALQSLHCICTADICGA